MALLLCLASRPGAVITRERLESAVWPGMIIGYDALSNTVGKLRKALGDDRKDPRFVETVPKMGYRLIGRVSLPRPRPRAARAASIAAAVLLAAALFAWTQTSEPPSDYYDHVVLPLPNKPSVAVLPFVSDNGDLNRDRFSDGLTEALIAGLAARKDLFVASRLASFVYQGKSSNPRQVGMALGVRYVVEGSVRWHNGKVRVNASLIDAVDGGHLWVKQYESSLEDPFAIQDLLAGGIKNELIEILAPDEREAPAPETSVGALEAFMNGWKHYQRRTRRDFAIANDYLLEAVALDPGYAQGYAALAALYWETKSWEWSPALGLDSLAVRQRAIEFLDKARAVPTVAGLITSARMHAKLGEHQAAIGDARRAVEMAPEDVDARTILAEVLVHAGQPSRALQHLDRVSSPHPPRRAYHSFIRGLAELSLEQYDAASASLAAATRLNPEYRVPAVALAAAYSLSNRRAQAASALELYLDEYRGCSSTINTTIATFFPFRNDQDRERLADGLRLAGMNEY